MITIFNPGKTILDDEKQFFNWHNYEK